MHLRGLEGLLNWAQLGQLFPTRPSSPSDALNTKGESLLVTESTRDLKVAGRLARHRPRTGARSFLPCSVRQNKSHDGGGCGLVAQSCPTLVTPRTARLLCPWGSPDKNAGVCCHLMAKPKVRGKKTYCILLIKEELQSHVAEGTYRRQGESRWARMRVVAASQSNLWVRGEDWRIVLTPNQEAEGFMNQVSLLGLITPWQNFSSQWLEEYSGNCGHVVCKT